MHSKSGAKLTRTDEFTYSDLHVIVLSDIPVLTTNYDVPCVPTDVPHVPYDVPSMAHVCATYATCVIPGLLSVTMKGFDVSS